MAACGWLLGGLNTKSTGFRPDLSTIITSPTSMTMCASALLAGITHSSYIEKRKSEKKMAATEKYWTRDHHTNGIGNVLAPLLAYNREASGDARSPTSAGFRARFETAMLLL